MFFVVNLWMEIVTLLKELGYSNQRVSEITAASHAVRDWVLKIQQFDYVNPLEAVSVFLAEFDQQLSREENGISWAIVGYHLAANGKDPEIQELLLEITPTILSWAAAYIRERAEPRGPAAKTSEELMARISQLFTDLSIGHALYRPKQLFQDVLPFLQKYQFLFLPHTRSFGDFKKDISFLHVLQNMELEPIIKVKELEKQRSLLVSMKKAYHAIQTPDPVKTIEDKIAGLNSKVEKTDNAVTSIITRNHFSNGYYFAIRGENPTIWELLHTRDESMDRFGTRYESFHFYVGELDPITISKKIDEIIEGYASSYLLAYLESELKKEKAKKETNLRLIEAPIAPILLKWTGQKNQLYDLLRNLKSRGYITNSYEELALFLKTNVEIFRGTALSTIQKELGKDKKLPKPKRMELQNFITPDNTA